MKIYLTFDVEEWVLPEDYKVESNHNNNLEFADKGCMKLLDLLQKHEITSTFFITGYFAERKKELVKEIASCGHEVASHGYKHVSFSSLDKKGAEDSIFSSKHILSRMAGKQIKGFRAPNFSFSPEMFQALLKSGYRYDSSVHPAIVPGHYYNVRACLEPYYPLKDKKLIEIPLSVFPGLRMPLSWVWMRNIGTWLTAYGVSRNLKKRDAALYFHTWEFVQVPRVKGIPFYIRRNTGERFLRMFDKFISGFEDCEFGRLEEFVK